MNAGASFDTVGETGGGMLGFALSPEGDQVAFGGPRDGLFVMPSDASAAPSLVSATPVTCLHWTTRGLYSCAAEPGSPFSLGFAAEPGQAFEPLWQRANSCRASCDPPSRLEMLCEEPWERVSSLVGAVCDGSTWIPDAGIDAGTGTLEPRLDGGGAETSVDAASASDAAPMTPEPADSGCAVAHPSRGSASWWLVPVLMLCIWIRRLHS